MKNKRINIDEGSIKEAKNNPKRDAAIISLRNKENKILLVRTRKLPEHWQPIGGGMLTYELPEEVIIREVYEEIGIKINFNKLIKIIEVPYDFGEGTIYCYDTSEVIKGKLNINENEIIKYKWFSLEEAYF